MQQSGARPPLTKVGDPGPFPPLLTPLVKIVVVGVWVGKI